MVQISILSSIIRRKNNHIITISRDVIKIKDINDIEKCIEELTELYQIFDVAADGIRVINKDFDVTRANETLEKITKTDLSEMKKKKCCEVFRGSLCHTPSCTLTQILNGKDSVEMSIEKTREDGSTVPCIISAKPFRNSKGEIIGVIEDFKDMTYIKEVEAKTALIFESSTPVVQVWEGVVVTPIIGTLDSERTQQIMEQLLEKIVETHSKIALIDITGVPNIDTAIAQHLVDTIKAVKLLGSQVVITGIKPSIAQTLVHLGINLTGVLTRKSLAEGIEVALNTLNLKIVSKTNSSNSI